MPGLPAELAATGEPAGPPAPGLVRAGQLLSRLDPLAALREHPGTDTLAVAVTGHSILNGPAAPLTGELACHGMLLKLYQGDYGAWLRELRDTGSDLYAAGADVVLGELPYP